jgi:hypothetical protein
MRPLLNIGDRIRIEATRIDQIGFRDIILFRSSNVFVTHRALGFENTEKGSFIVQCGDAGGPPMRIPATAALGVVTAFERNGRLFCLTKGRGRWLNQYLGWKALIVFRITTFFGIKQDALRGWLDFSFVRICYRLVMLPIRWTQHLIIRLLMTTR